MASLPPRPGSPSRPRDAPSPRRGRPQLEPGPPRRLVDRLDPPRGSRAPPPVDSYVAGYDRERRDSGFGGRRMEFERRDRGWPERSRERGPPLPPPRRSPEPFDRDRRPPPPHFDLRDRADARDRPDRDRADARDRPFDRGDRYRPEPPRWGDGRPASPPRFPRRNSRSPNFRRSRSPPRRRPSPPPPRRPLSPRPRSRSPPFSAKRIKLGNHSIVRSPSRGRLPPSRPRSVRDERSRSPPRFQPRAPEVKDKDEEPEPGLIIEDEPPVQYRARTPTRPRARTPTKSEPPPVKSEPPPKREPSPIKADPPEPPLPDVKLEAAPKMEDVQPAKDESKEPPAPAPAPPRDEKLAALDVSMRAPSPPRHPRNRGGAPPARGTIYQRRTSRSPPRGPRGDRDRERERPPARGRGGRRGLPSQAASFSSAGPSTYAAGPSTYPPAPPTPTTPLLAALPPPPTAPKPKPKPEPETPLPKLPVVPAWDVRDHERSELAAAQKASAAHRAVLRAQASAMEKAARRAVHELTAATLELRAAEGRRRVADVHLDKARAGVLGIAYVPPLDDIA